MMKLSAALLLLAALVSAAPFEVNVADRSAEPITPKWRIGFPGAKHTHTPKDTILVEEAVHILPFPADMNMASPAPPSIPQGAGQSGKPGRKPCHGGNKSIELANKFRKLLGMPTISVEPIELGSGTKLIHVEFIPAPMSAPAVAATSPHHHHHNHHHAVAVAGKSTHGHMKDWHKRPFADRLTHALMSLGRWEGRFVAFVLGCGIGVLLRLFWVMGLLIARSFRNRRTEDEDEHEVVLTEEEQYLLPPPEYTDEKVALAMEEEQRRRD